MNIKNVVLSVFCLLMTSVSVFAQLNVLNAKTPEEIGVKTEDQLAYDNDSPLPYGFIDDRDILWSKSASSNVNFSSFLSNSSWVFFLSK